MRRSSESRPLSVSSQIHSGKGGERKEKKERERKNERERARKEEMEEGPSRHCFLSLALVREQSAEGDGT